MSYFKKIVSCLASLLLFLFFAPVFVHADTCPTPGQNLCWVERAPMPTSRFVFNVAADASGHIYAAGGEASGVNLNNLEMYDPATDTWVTKTSAPVVSVDGGFTFNAVTGKFYYLSGNNSADFFEYEPVTDHWTLKAGMPIDGFNIRIAAAPSGKIYAIGGSYNQQNYPRLTNVYEYDPATDTWTTKSALPHFIGANCLVTAPNGKIYTIGGGTPTNVVNFVDQYDPTTDTWASKAPMPTARNLEACSLNANGNIVVAGGNLDTVETFTDIVEMYNPSTNSWSSLSPLPYAVGDNGMALGSDNKLYLPGGKTFSQEHIATTLSGFVPDPQLTALAPTKVWVGVSNILQAGVKFDLLAQVYKDSTVVSSGQINSFSPGNTGLFVTANLATIPFSSFTPVDFATGSALKLKVSVRNACSGSLRNQGIARLWYNDSAANSQFGATITSSNDYFLRDGFVLATTAGLGPKKTIDVQSGAKCSPFKTFGTWTITP